jgi:hypothetical protein
VFLASSVNVIRSFGDVRAKVLVSICDDVVVVVFEVTNQLPHLVGDVSRDFALAG